VIHLKPLNALERSKFVKIDIRKKSGVFIFFVLTAVFVMCSAALADDIAEAGRKVAFQWGKAVVYVELVVRIDYGDGRPEESKPSGTGVIVDPYGLTLVPMSGTGIDFDGAKVVSAKIRLYDGTEMPSAVVLRDADLDMVFLRPLKKPAKPMAFVDMKTGVKVSQLQDVVVLFRQEKIANCALSAVIEQIRAVVDKPRLFYVPSLSAGSSEYGAPVFSLEGRPVGVVLYRYAASSSSYSDSDSSSIKAIIPAADVLKAAVQAPKDVPKAPSKQPTKTNKPAAKPKTSKH